MWVACPSHALARPLWGRQDDGHGKDEMFCEGQDCLYAVVAHGDPAAGADGPVRLGPRRYARPAVVSPQSYGLRHSLGGWPAQQAPAPLRQALVLQSPAQQAAAPLLQTLELQSLAQQVAHLL